MSEKWLWVDGYEGLYMVSDMGNVMRVPYKGHKGHELKLKTNSHGYVRVQLSKDNVATSKTVHRLVANAFLDNPDNKPQVNHIDGNKENNQAENLEWVTASENETHSYRVLGKINPRSTKYIPLVSKRVLDDCQVEAIRSDTSSSRELAKKYGVSHTTIKNIRNFKIYKEAVNGN